MYALLVALVCLIIFSFIRAFISPLSLVPGPFVTRFTTLLLKYHELRGNRRLFIHALHQKYGPTVRLGPNEVAFANLEAMKEIYMSNGSGYDKTEFYNLFRQYGTRTAFSTLNKADHSQRKRHLADRYAMTNILRPEIVSSIHACSQSVLRACQRPGGGSVDVYEVLHCYALDCASHFLFGEQGTNSLHVSSDLELMKELSFDNSLQRRLLVYYWPRIASLLELFSPASSKRSVSKSAQYVLDKTVTPDPTPYSLIEKLRSKASELRDIDMSAECMDHLAAGIDTTGDGLCFLMWHLSQPENLPHQRRLQEELLANPTYRPEDFVYLDAVIKEGLRCFPPIPMSLPRYVPSDGRTINGYFLPGCTIVSCQAWSVNRLDEQVFPEPDAFKPERWLEEEGFHERNRLFFSFASGGRGCIGKNLATTEMKVLLRDVYSTFSTTVSRNMNGDMSIDDQIIASRPKDQMCLLDFQKLDMGSSQQT